ncbi:hypothetical protein EMN47_19190 [Prolixibacteraceae bacterium JC049]|nr:hypothetical protein [Prolixibacteraceae bacterium JC049]
MILTFKIDIKHQLKSISNGLWNIGMLPVVMFFLWFIKGINPLEPYLVIGLLLWTLLWFIPTLILHPLYFSINRKSKLIYNNDNQELKVIQDDNILKFKRKDIKVIERIYYSDFRLAKWKQNYIPMPWRNYGLIRILTYEDDEIFLTSLMIDIVNPPIKPTLNTYKFIPFPPKTLKQKQNEKKEVEESRKKRIEFFKMKFSTLTLTDLNHIINDEDLVEEAKITAKELINEKNTTANKS